MNKLEEQLARDLIQNIKDAQRNSLTLAAIVEDADFELLSMMLQMMLVAKAQGDLEDFARACSKVAGQKNAARNGGSAISSIINTFDGMGN
jgi:glycosyltransferase A (GT-A) superfamily protein (DUF2064 family)